MYAETGRISVPHAYTAREIARYPVIARSYASGFTVVELVVTLVMIGILAAIAVPRLMSFNAFSSRSFFDESRSVVRYAQKVAIAQRRSVFVVVTATRVRACYDAACANVVPNPTDAADPLGAHTDMTEGRWRLAAGQIVLSPVVFSFNGLGQPSAPAVITFTSNVAGDPQRTITVAAETGYVY